MKRLTHEQLAYYQFDLLQEDSVQHGVFTRLGGVSQGVYRSLNLSRSTGDAPEPVNENRHRMFAALGLNAEQSLSSWLVHGNSVRVVSNADLGQNDVHADAMITNTCGLALTLRFADCVPVLFLDPVRQAIGIAHAGWVGIVVGVLPATVQAMRRTFGSDPGDIRACIGPSIGPDRFEVGEDVAAKIQAAVSDRVAVQPGILGHQGHSTNDTPAEPPAATKPHVDLWRAAESQLYTAGLRQIETARICTASNTGEWFSHRAEKGKTGRFGAVIELRRR